MAHGPSHEPLPATLPPGHHPSAEDEYLVQPPGAEHEHSDANVWIIVKFGLWLAISAVVISAGMGLLFGLFVKQSEETVVEFPLAGQEHRAIHQIVLWRDVGNQSEAQRGGQID